MHTSLMPHGLYTYDICVCRTLSHSSSAIYSSGLSWGSTCVTGFGTSLCSALNGCIKPQAAPTRTLLSLSVVLGVIHFPCCVCVCHAPSQHGFSLLLLSQRLVLRIGNTGPDTTNGPASGWSVCLLSYVHLGRCCCCCCRACTSVWCCCCCPCTHGSDFPVDNGHRLGNDSA